MKTIKPRTHTSPISPILWLLTELPSKRIIAEVEKSGVESTHVWLITQSIIGASLIEAIWRIKPPTKQNVVMKPPYDGLINTVLEMGIFTYSTENNESGGEDNNENTYQFSNSRRLPGESKKCI